MSEIVEKKTSAQVRRFQSYPKYKDSGVEWLGDIPKHWNVRRLKHIASVKSSNVDKKMVEGEQFVRLCNYVDVYYNDYITPDLNFMEATASRAEISKFILREGDVLITKDSESWDDIAIPAYVSSGLDGVVCGYHLAQIQPNAQQVIGGYLFRSFHARGLNDQFRVAATGITRYGLGKYWIDNSLFLVPQKDEQRAIAKFLDRETARIDALIAKKRRMIELLQEKRKAIISHVVTKGLNPDTPMKDSGVEWIGKVPKHWEVTRLGWISEEINDINHEMPESVSDGTPFLSAKDLLDDGTLNFETDIKKISEVDFIRLSKKICPQKRDIIYSRIGACLGKARIVETDTKFLISYSCCVIRLMQKRALPEYFGYLLDSELVLVEARIRTQGIGVPDLGLKEIARFPVPLPPVEEQKNIAVDLLDKVSRHNRLLALVKDGISKLEEYRAALISAAVTGKIDIRGKAA